MLEVMIVNGKRYLLNTDSPGVDAIADEILSHYDNPELDWDEVRECDIVMFGKPWETNQ